MSCCYCASRCYLAAGRLFGWTVHAQEAATLVCGYWGCGELINDRERCVRENKSPDLFATWRSQRSPELFLGGFHNMGTVHPGINRNYDQSRSIIAWTEIVCLFNSARFFCRRTCHNSNSRRCVAHLVAGKPVCQLNLSQGESSRLTGRDSGAHSK
jgi:hypothetical protein